MSSISIGSSVEHLWDLLGSSNTNASINRVIFVEDRGSIVGIITDGDIRRFIAQNRRLPLSVAELVRKDFLRIHRSDSRQVMITELMNELEKRNWFPEPPIKDLIIEDFDGKMQVHNLSEFTNELLDVATEYVVIGMGYVGLTLLAVLGFRGHKAIGIESDLSKFKQLTSKEYYVKEPRLEDYLNSSVAISYFQNLKESRRSYMANGDRRKTRRIYVIAVNTPVGDNKNIDPSFLEKAVIDISEELQTGDIVILRSTVPVGTSEILVKKLQDFTGYICGLDFFFGYAPERTVEGNAIAEIETLPQIIGGYTNACISRSERAALAWAPNILVSSSCRAAEMAKLINNSFRDYYFAFANEAALLSNSFKVDVGEVIRLANVGYPRSFVPRPSPGVGGPCLSKDSYLLLGSTLLDSNHSQPQSYTSAILSARKVNEIMPDFCSRIIQEDIDSLEINNPSIHIIGLAFKGVPETNDIRNSPAINILANLKLRNLEVTGWDANLNERQLNLYGIDSLQKTQKNLILVIGNNHPSNVERVNSLTRDYCISYIFDPWELLDENGILVHLLNKGAHVRTLSKIIEANKK